MFKNWLTGNKPTKTPTINDIARARAEAIQLMDENKSTNALVEEIHDTFYTEVDRILEQAKITKSYEIDKTLESKAERLKKLGFNSAKELKLDSVQQRERTIIDSERKKNEELVEAVNYFSFKYPHYKFITEDSIKKICEKYGLVYGEVGKYIGEVPEENLKHIEDFKIDEKDNYISYSSRILSVWSSYTEEEFRHRLTVYNDVSPERVDGIVENSKICASLIIAAPKDKFDMTRMEVKDYKLQNIPDPVVFKPVMYKDKQYFLIVTAWGAEAKDSLVVNEKLN